jgi:membrane-associated protease RseP (regulator of RpoE activity)
MSEYDIEKGSNIDAYVAEESDLVVAQVVYEPPPRRRVWLPIGLFVATCLSTLYVGAAGNTLTEALIHGLQYAVPLMTILICHEAGHFFQARRYGVHASFPFFIPMPYGPLGTFGAVIGMEAHKGDRKALFDIGISGPLAGLVPTLIFCVVGLHWSEAIPQIPKGAQAFGSPLLFDALSEWIVQPTASRPDIGLHPMAFAGWVGLLVTALNLIPVGQLDGGHVLYALLRTRAHQVGSILLLCAVAIVIWFSMFHWLAMLFLLIMMGPVHPPTANDNVPLGAGRVILGWLTLAFIFIGFTPVPIMFVR